MAGKEAKKRQALRYSCRRKEAYFSMNEAENARMNAEVEGVTHGSTNSYYCEQCVHYRWGHLKGAGAPKEKQWLSA